MPIFGFCKERFDPDLPFAHGFVVSLRLVVALDAFEIGGMEGAMHLPTVVARGTVRFQRTGIAGGGIRTVFSLLRLGFYPSEAQWLTIGADVEIVCCIVDEHRGSIIGRHVLPIRQGNRGADALGAEWP